MVKSRCYVKILIPLCTFLKFHTHLEENLARSFQNVFDKCSKVLNLVFLRNWNFHENHHILGYHTTLRKQFSPCMLRSSLAYTFSRFYIWMHVCGLYECMCLDKMRLRDEISWIPRNREIKGLETKTVFRLILSQKENVTPRQQYDSFPLLT